ncbi:MAG: hypothetical protein WC683_13605 [bacterium]
MARLSGKAGAVHLGLQTVHACDAAWTTAGAGRVSTLDTTDYKVGSGAAKVVTTTIGGTTLLHTIDFAAINLAAYVAILLWVKSSVNQSAGDCQLLLDDTSACASPLESLDLPALTADVWKFCKLALANPGSDTAIISAGIKQITDLADMTFRCDAIEAAKTIAGIKSWTLDQEVEVLETTAFDSSGVRSFAPTLTGWKGSFEGFKDGAPLTIGTVIGLELRESATATQQFRGSAIITKLNPKVDISGLVTYAYEFQGIHGLEIASA